MELMACGRTIIFTLIGLTLCIGLSLGACPRIISRQEWNAEPAEGVGKIPKPIPYLAIHHTYLPGFCFTTDECKKAMKSIQNYHKNELKWGDIGYSFCIGGDGNIYEGRGWNGIGAHTKGWNSVAIGLCFIGDFRTKRPTPEMLKRIAELEECGISQGHFKKDFKIFGHMQVGSTECPGQALQDYIKTLKRWTPKPTK